MNIGEITREIVNELQKNGEFNGVKIDVNISCKEEWRECYAIFIVDIIDFDIIENTSEYFEFHEDDFWDDLYTWVSSYFDESIEIDIFGNTGKVEIYDEVKIKDEAGD